MRQLNCWSTAFILILAHLKKIPNGFYKLEKFCFGVGKNSFALFRALAPLNISEKALPNPWLNILPISVARRFSR